MIMNFIAYPELINLVSMVLHEIDEIKNSDFVEGKYNNHHGTTESFTDRLEYH